MERPDFSNLFACLTGMLIGGFVIGYQSDGIIKEEIARIKSEGPQIVIGVCADQELQDEISNPNPTVVPDTEMLCTRLVNKLEYNIKE